MWAQLITMKQTQGSVRELDALIADLHATEHGGSGLLRSITMTDRADPTSVHVLVVFESEAKARAREADESRAAALAPVRAQMAEMFEGPPDFTDLDVVAEYEYPA